MTKSIKDKVNAKLAETDELPFEGDLSDVGSAKNEAPQLTDEQLEKQERMVLANLQKKYADGDMEDNAWAMHTVKLSDKSFTWVPTKNEAQVLKEWCLENCEKGGFKMMDDQSWIFKNKKDAKAFEMAWNVRAK